MSIWGNRDYFKDYFWMIEGGLFGDGDCIVSGGFLQSGVSFLRGGDVVYDGKTFGPNTYISYGGQAVHHGQITATVPAYDISPFTRPTSPDVYDTCASAPNPDKHGVNWEYSDPKNKWVWDLLDGAPSSVEAFSAGAPDIIQAGWTNNGDGTYSFDGSNTTNSVAWSTPLDPSISVGDMCQVETEVLDYTSGVLVSRVGYSGPAITPNYTGVGVYTDRVMANNTTAISMVTGSPAFIGRSRINSVRKILPATGTLTLSGLNIRPSKAEWNTVGTKLNILAGATGNDIVYVGDDGFFRATDGTNICVASAEYTPGVAQQVSLVFGENQMQILVDGVAGGLAPFVGTFSPGETLKWGLANEDIFEIASVCGNTTATFGEALQLAQDLAFDL